MAIETPTVWPQEITAGNTLSFQLERDDFPASTWTMTYRLISAAQAYSVVATADGDAHQFSAAATVTATWDAGTYQYVITASDGTDRCTVAEGFLEVLPDPAGGASDNRHHVRKVLDALEATLEGKASDDILMIEIGGRPLTKLSPGELLSWRDKYKAELARIEQEERMAAGLGSRRKIKARIR